ncbi:hypothetical protein MATL_G00118650 [Megalops atlanticus]|uniref:Single-pass membrane and coiled-coil domain-containing protein 4 n=1 Tax=Megalops atlanticus TaxID=7932 RepID=A0A9D3PZB7_MEGAT|nr:hypothetical protein MATL_G00118650 [Megalops atlanticus]
MATYNRGNETKAKFRPSTPQYRRGEAWPGNSEEGPGVPAEQVRSPECPEEPGKSSSEFRRASERKGGSGAMRQLKGKPKKETSKDKKERKQAMQEARQQIATVVLPTLAVVVLLIVVFVYVATRPGAIE